MKTIGEKPSAAVQRLRRKRKMTQLEAAELTGIPVRSIQRAEDPRGRVSLKTLRAIAKGFGVPISEILGDMPERDQSPLRALETIVGQITPEKRALIDFVLSSLNEDQARRARAGLESMFEGERRRSERDLVEPRNQEGQSKIRR